MKSTRRLIIHGAGGFGAEVLWIARAVNEAAAFDFVWDPIGFSDDNPSLKGTQRHGLKVLGTCQEMVAEFGSQEVWFHCAIGVNTQRFRTAGILELGGLKAATLIHPSVVMAGDAEVKEGCLVAPFVVLAPSSKVGRHVIINTHVGVGHHSQVGDFVNLCPGARVSGGCFIDKCAFMGSNSVLHPGKTMGEGATLGPNSYAIRSMAPRVTAMGVPARIVSRPASNESPAV